jgi:hypothetical protein
MRVPFEAEPSMLAAETNDEPASTSHAGVNNNKKPESENQEVKIGDQVDDEDQVATDGEEKDHTADEPTDS